MLKEFKAFALKGNMVDLAVGMIIGSAFTAIVNSLVNDLVMPLLGLLTGNIDFSNLFIALDGKTYATLAEAEEVGAAVFKYGSFLGQVLNFIIVAFVLFLIVRSINRAREKAAKPVEAAPAAPTAKECPYCKSTIHIGATRCPQCTAIIDETQM